MEYISCAEAAEKWGISARRVQKLCEDNRIPGAKELLEELNLEYNKLRQQGITTELLDILGGQVER